MEKRNEETREERIIRIIRESDDPDLMIELAIKAFSLFQPETPST